MVDPKPLLKLFGEGASVVTQIATDTSTNARRQTSSSFDPTIGQLIEDYMVGTDGVVPHSLGRLPKGAIVLRSYPEGNVTCSGFTVSEVFLSLSAATTVTLWVV